MKNVVIYCVCVLYSLPVFAQKDSKTGNSSFSINFSGVPVQNISGVDTSFQNALSIAPVIDLRSKSGWGFSYSPSIVTSGIKSGVYMHSLSAGYERYDHKDIDLVFNYSHFIFTNSTSVPYSPLNNEVFFSIAYSKGWIKPVFSTSIGFGRDSSRSSVHDFALATGISHDFSWEDKGPFSGIELTPSILLNGSTDGYFSFLHASRYISKSRNFSKLVKNIGKKKRSSASRSSFSFSNVELNMETNFEMGSFSLRPSGSIFLPLSSSADNSVYGFAQLSLQYHF